MAAIRRKPWRSFVAYGAVGLLAWITSAPISGCTVLGFTAGALTDTFVGKGGPSRLVRVRPGTRVTLWLRDGSKVRGVFERVREEPRPAYEARFAAWRDTGDGGADTPKLGSRMHVISVSGDEEGEFMGVGLGTLAFRAKGDSSVRLVAWKGVRPAVEATRAPMTRIMPALP